MRVEIENEQQVIRRLEAADSRITLAVESGQEEFADELVTELENTSPVRTGEYKGSWGTDEEGDTVYIVNNDPKAKYLVFPNQRMRGSPKADLPAQGILHNVRGITFNKRRSYREKVSSKIRNAARSLIRSV